MKLGSGGSQASVSPFPTLLVLEMDPQWRAMIVGTLRNEGFNVLEAKDLPDALLVAKTHSRPVQLLVTGLRCGPAFTGLMQQFRPGMEVMQVTRERMFHEPNVVVHSVRQFFAASTKQASHEGPTRSEDAAPTQLLLRTRTAGTF